MEFEAAGSNDPQNNFLEPFAAEAPFRCTNSTSVNFKPH